MESLLAEDIRDMQEQGIDVKNFQAEADKFIKSLPQLDINLQHFFIEGVYVRMLKIPKGAGISGKFHLTDHISILAEGTLRVIIDNEIVELTAPFIAVTPKGTRKTGYAVTDCTFINVIRTDSIDVAFIEDTVVCDTEEEVVCRLQQL